MAIDYQKLQQALILLGQYQDENNSAIRFELEINRSKNLNFRFRRWGEEHYLDDDSDFSCIDDLITKLKELTAPKPKYSEGDTVFSLICRGKCGLMQGNTDAFDSLSCEYYVRFEGEGDYWIKENELYPSRESLIQAQIDYWTSLQKEEISTHSDDMSMTPSFEGPINSFRDRIS